MELSEYIDCVIDEPADEPAVDCVRGEPADEPGTRPVVIICHEEDEESDYNIVRSSHYGDGSRLNVCNDDESQNSRSDISSEVSSEDMEDIMLESNDTDIAFAEDTTLDFSFDIDLSDGAEQTEKPQVRKNSEMREKAVKKNKQPALPANLSLKHAATGSMVKSFSSPSLLETVGCFGFGGEDYYHKCAQIVTEARQREKLKDYKGANQMLKAAVEILIAGVQHDPDPMRREGVRRRTAEYLQIADNFAERYHKQKLSKKPTLISIEEVRRYRVLSVQDKIMIVESAHSGIVRVLKTLRKPLNSTVSGQCLVVRVPFMVHLDRCCVSQEVVFLLLKRIHPGYEIQDYVKRFKHSAPLPKSLSVSSHCSEDGQTPQSTGQTPQSTGQTPQSTGQTPQSTGQTAQSTGQTAQSTGQTAQSTGQTPQSPGKTPQSPGQTPQSTGQTAQSTGQTPQSTGQTLLSGDPTAHDTSTPEAPLPVPKSGRTAPAHLVRKWSAQLVVCLSSLHKQGLVYADLHLRNILIDDFSNVCVTYITQLPGLHHRVSARAVSEMFVAPEALTGLHAVTVAADWWSLGAVLFYLFTGYPLSHYFPYSAIRTMKVQIPSEIQSGGSSLVAGLLKYNPTERLGGGVMASEEIRSHSYFSSTDWDNLEKSLYKGSHDDAMC